MIIIIRKKLLRIFCCGLLLILALALIPRVPHIPAAAKPADDAVPLPIIMYHSVMKDPNYQGAYVISPATFEADIQYLQEQGYTTVFVSEVAAYVEDGQALPQKPVILSFDDGNLNNLTYIVPLLEQYDMKAVISVVGEFTERALAEDAHNPAYSNLTWDEINQALACGRVEIGNHTYALHDASGRRGASPMRGESQGQYQQVLEADLQKLQNSLKENCGVEPIVFAYPFGFIHKDSLAVIKALGFKASFSCNEKMNYITRDSDCLFCLGRYNRPAGVSTEKFMQKALN